MRFPPSHIEPDLKATERYAAIQELVHLLVTAGAIAPDCEQAIYSAVRQREETLSTGIGYGTAMPHGTTDHISHPIFAFGRSRQGVEFASLDGAPVQMIFLMLVPKGHDLTGLFGKSKPRPPPRAGKKLMECSTAQEIADLLNSQFDDDEPPA